MRRFYLFNEVIATALAGILGAAALWRIGASEYRQAAVDGMFVLLLFALVVYLKWRRGQVSV